MTRLSVGMLVLTCVLPGGLSGQLQVDLPSSVVRADYASVFDAVDEGPPVPTVLEAPSVPAPELVPQLTGRSGRTYMIAGAAALIGGLLVGGDVGTVIAAGGVLLGVYGIILYY